MIEKYHVNPMTGNVSPCKATIRPCIFGGSDVHYSTPEAARAAFEEEFSGETLRSVRLTQGSNVEEKTPRRDIEAEEKARKAAEEASARRNFEEETDGFDRVSLPSIRFKKGTISDAARELLSSISGGLSYEKTIDKAKERARMASVYFEEQAKEKSSDFRFLSENSSPASAQSSASHRAALGARLAGAGDISRIVGHTHRATDPEATAQALAAARRRAQPSSPIGRAALSF